MHYMQQDTEVCVVCSAPSVNAVQGLASRKSTEEQAHRKSAESGRPITTHEELLQAVAIGMPAVSDWDWTKHNTSSRALSRQSSLLSMTC